MLDFFKGCRRKIGVAMLAVGLLFLLAWMRSQVYTDLFALPNNASAIAGYWGIGVEYSAIRVTPQFVQWRTFHTPTPTEIKAREQYFADAHGPDEYWKWEFCGF